MRKAFNIAVAAILVFVISDRAFMHAQADEKTSITCAKGAELVKSDALGKGYPEMMSNAQSENFLSNCLVTGRASVGNLIARN
jgi:hypothetical protein